MIEYGFDDFTVQTVDHDLGSVARRFGTTVGNGATVSLCVVSWTWRTRPNTALFQVMTTLDATACQMWNLQMPTPGPLTTLMPTLNFACLTTLTVTLSIQTCWG